MLAVHPRLRGEHRVIWRDKKEPGGSSPLTRGTRFCVHAPILSNAVHPRLRGEHGRAGAGEVLGGGSSPLTRGTLHFSAPQSRAGRFIPAYAGNTSACVGTAAAPAVHPRLRGEHGSRTIPPARHGGSSPLTRGTPKITRHSSPGLRFIPAYAGNTTWRW